ncbi:hypothetical protein [Amycolatopsis sp. CA-126428]|uniref:hypothetical protein n=1 Tax=Amycolatopsis sp. CA-126428 TaxID=2073158 RepID=UPI000CD09427|nr:hypothetical protein [Amycolatopsis sp. CA-126428]
MTEEQDPVFEAGREAYRAGLPNAPALSEVVMDTIGDMPVGTGAAAIMGRFQDGWRDAYLSANGVVHFGSPSNSGRPACMSRSATPQLTDDPRAVTCEACHDTEDWLSYADMADFAASLPEPEPGADRFEILREIRDKFVARKVDGVPVDPQTANAILTVYDSDAAKAKPEFRTKFAALPILEMAATSWRLVSRRR